MPPLPTRFLDTVVMFTETDKPRYVATGFLCHHRIAGREPCEGLFLVSSAQAVHGDSGHTNLVCRSRRFFGPEFRPAAGKGGIALGDWLTEPELDIAVLPLDRQELWSGPLRYQALNTDRGALTSSGMKRRRVGEGDDVFIVGFAPEQVHIFPVPMVRRGIIARIRDLYRGESPTFLVEATISEANQGSPVIMAPTRGARNRPLIRPGFKLVGMVAGYLPNPEQPLRRNQDGRTLLVRMNTGLVRVIPVNAICELLETAVERTPRLAEARHSRVRSRTGPRQARPPESHPYLDTVVLLEGLDGEERLCTAGTGVFCRALDWNSRARQMLFLVTSAHVIRSDLESIRVLFRPREGARAVPYSVTAKTGLGPSTWFTDSRHDLAALLLDPEQLPARDIRYRTFEAEIDTLTIPELRGRQTSEGDEALLVGFVEPQHDGRAETPAVRLASICDIPKRASPRRPFILEGIAFPGNSGSPVILKPGRDAGQGRDDDVGGKLIGIVCKTGNAATLVRSNEEDMTAEFKETTNVIVVVPVDALRHLIRHSIGDTILAEKFGPKLRRVRGWLRRERT